MKKIVFIFLFFFFFSSFKIHASFAQENTPVISVSLIPAPEAKQINYSLPYPGILPDNRLYFTKVIRDKLISLLISNPLKKAEFDLLVADKRLASGFYLTEKGNFKLAETTISKGENYFGEAIDKTREAKKQGMDISHVTQQLFDASEKHKEVIKGLEAKSPKDLKQSFHGLYKRMEGFEKEVNSLTFR
ncbi:MAG: DUF5667 domain-containing protein [Patescibacteria group bacterium]|nr:DUF5667 domain-containing protein [Patescibacteria group bacterium]